MIVLKIISLVLSVVLVVMSGYKLHKHHSYDKLENRMMIIETVYWGFWAVLNLFSLFI